MERINLKSTIRKIEDYEVVSFDIFDTLIKRNLSEPKSLFDYVEREYNRIHPEWKVSDFRSCRSAAEREARELHPLKEVTLDEIYSFLSFQERVKTQLKELEISLELKFCVPNYDLLYIYRKCQRLSKRIILISDMYLPKTVIEDLLSKCGIEKYEKLYLSSEIGVQKKDGRLYDFVINDLKVKSSSILHFGDRKKTDNLIPRLKGMHNVYVPHFYRYTAFITQSDLRETNNSLFPFLNNYLPQYRRCGNVFRWGYEALGPMIVGFCSWIHKMAVRTELNTLFFLSRDMYLFVEVYRQMYGHENRRIEYLEVSRKSLRIAYLLKKGTLKAVFDTMPRKSYTVGEILDSIDVSSDELKEASENLKNHIDRNDKAYLDDHCVDWFDDLDGQIIPILKKKENNTYSYLEQMGLIGNEKKAIIDIGWHGTIQNMLETICDDKLTGLYMGISKRNTFDIMEVYGYWFKLKNEVDQARLLSVTYILETVLFPHLGTTTGYEIIDEKYCPVYEEKEVADYSVIAQFQNGARRFVTDYTSFFVKEHNIGSKEAMRAFLRLAFEPGREQVRIFAGLQHEDGIIKNMVETKPNLYYLLHPYEFKNDFNESRWKEGYLSLFFPCRKNLHMINVSIQKTRDGLNKIKRRIKSHN